MTHHHYDGPERRRDRQSAYDRILHSVAGVLSTMAGVAVISATVALSAQRFIGAPAANARAITEIINQDSTLTFRVGVIEDDVVILKDRTTAMELQHIDIGQQLRRLGVVICASLGDPADREVRVACAALTNGTN